MSSIAYHRLLADLPLRFQPMPALRFFHPKDNFIEFMATEFPKNEIWDIGAGDGFVADKLYQAGLKVVAIDIMPRENSQFAVMIANGVSYEYPEDAVLLFCRPCHNGFVEATIYQGLRCGVRRYAYVGLAKNVDNDLGSFRKKFRRVLRHVGNEGECLYKWEI